MLQKSIGLRVAIVTLSLVLLTGFLAGSAGAAPKVLGHVTISDVRSTTFTVSWVTDTAGDGNVTYGTSQPPSIVAADSLNPTTTTTHWVRISGLSPNTTYYFQVSSSGSDLDNTIYQVTTGPTIPFRSPSNTIQGHVYQCCGTTAAPYAIVYLQLQHANDPDPNHFSQLVSTRADTSGYWSYTLSNARTNNFQAYFTFTPGTDNLRINGQGGSYGTHGLDPNPPDVITIPTTDPFTHDITLDQAPTAVTLASFTGSLHPNRVQLDWATADETGLVGFYLYRSENPGGVKHKLNPNLIPAQTPGRLTGNSYQYRDGTAESGKAYSYWIELVMRDGNQEYGPVSLLVPYWVWLPIAN